MPTVNGSPNTFGEVINRCQSLMGDPTGRWVTQAYAGAIINQAYSDMAHAIKLASGKNLEAIIEVLNVPPGTISLYPLQTYGDLSADPPVQPGPLVGLFDPLDLWVKTAGALPQYYTRARGPRDTLPHVNPPGVAPGNFGVQVTFAWIGNKLCITPVAGAIDIQVYGRFNVPRLVQLTDNLVLDPDMTDTLAYNACGLMGVERSNPTVTEGYAQRGLAGIDNIVASIILQCQKNPRRLAKMGGRGGTSWGWGVSR
jgi:hypothetical protein